MAETDRTLRMPTRSGRIEGGAARALYLAALCAGTDATRPVLCDVLWEGADDCTRAVGTDSYRLMMVEVQRTRAGIKPATGRSWGLRAAGVRQALRLQRWRSDGQGIEYTRASDNCRIMDPYGDAHTAKPCGEQHPRWRNMIPGEEEGISWRAAVALGDLARLMRRMSSVYRGGSWGPRVIITPEAGAVGLWPSIDARIKYRRWPVPYVGGQIAAYIQVTRDEPVALNAVLPARPLWRAVEWLGEDQEIEIIVRDRLEPIILRARPEEHQCRELLLVVMPMQLGEVWAEDTRQEEMAV